MHGTAQASRGTAAVGGVDARRRCLGLRALARGSPARGLGGGSGGVQRRRGCYAARGGGRAGRRRGGGGIAVKKKEEKHRPPTRDLESCAQCHGIGLVSPVCQTRRPPHCQREAHTLINAARAMPSWSSPRSRRAVLSPVVAAHSSGLAGAGKTAPAFKAKTPPVVFEKEKTR